MIKPNTRGIGPDPNPATWKKDITGLHVHPLLSLNFLVLLDGLDMLMALKSADLVLGEVNRKALDKGVFVSDLAALVDSLLLQRGNLLIGGIILGGNNVGRHFY